MPIVKRSKVSFFDLEPFSDILINPINCIGAMGAGLALEFRERYPDMYAEYRDLCQEGRITIGKLHVYRTTNKIIVGAPTKRHWADPSDLDDVIATLWRIREFLQTVPFHTAAMVMLGTGMGKLGQELVEPKMFEILDDLPNVIHLSMRPDAFERQPRYLGIVGSKDYTDYDRVELGVLESLVEWGLTLSDFDGVVSGGAPGVDTCAEKFAQLHKLKPIVVRADWQRYGRSAGMRRNPYIADIATHLVAFPAVRSSGTRNTIELVNKYNQNMIDSGSTDAPKKMIVLEVKV